jgi:hypothetical protein
VSSLAFDNKIENLYEKEKNRESTKRERIIENCLTRLIINDSSSNYVVDEIGYLNMINIKSTELSAVQYLSIDLILKLIAFEETYYFPYDVSLYLIYQFYVFIQLDILLDKIQNLFIYYTKRKSMC